MWLCNVRWRVCDMVRGLWEKCKGTPEMNLVCSG
jgi:hypothetical protein